MSKQSAGGIATAKIQKEQSVLRKKEYDLNPNNCRFCKSPIYSSDIKLRETKLKKFCNHSCSAKNNNQNRPKRINFCKFCKISIFDRKKICDECKPLNKKVSFVDRSKGDLFSSSKNWQSARSRIQKHARQIFIDSSSEKSCKVCGYDRHYEVCHIKDVSSFSDTSTISEINAIDNLVAFCPTHHWEFDNAYVKF